MDEENLDLSLTEISEFVEKTDPQFSARGAQACDGEGFVQESIFFVKKNQIIWIVKLSWPRTFAFKKVSPEFLEVLSEIIVDSPKIFVEFNRHHKIIAWAAIQEKLYPKP